MVNNSDCSGTCKAQPFLMYLVANEFNFLEMETEISFTARS